VQQLFERDELDDVSYHYLANPLQQKSSHFTSEPTNCSTLVTICEEYNLAIEDEHIAGHLLRATIFNYHHLHPLAWLPYLDMNSRYEQPLDPLEETKFRSDI
jgi:hypothetical protein